MKQSKIAELPQEIMLLADLKPNPKNPNTHPESQIAKLRHLIKRHGYYAVSITIQKSTGFIIKGHGVREALQLEGYDKALVNVKDCTDAEADSILIADNKSASDSIMDDSSLQQLISELSDQNIPSLDFGFDSQDLYDLASRILADSGGYTADEKDDQIPEVVEPITKTGDLWHLGNKHRVLCADSTVKENVDKLLDGNKVDLIFTDPPYDLDVVNLDNIFNFCDNHIFIMNADKNSVLTAYSHFDNFVVFYIIYFDKPTWNLSRLIPLTQHTHISHFKMDKAKSYDLTGLHSVIHLSTKLDESSENKHAKRIEIPYTFINYFSDKKDKVLDLFLGSGSTLIACEKLNRVLYGMEIDCHYVDVIIKRFIDYVGSSKNVFCERNGLQVAYSEISQN
jgi:16S rRNA G966 N2-methylase RsmD